MREKSNRRGVFLRKTKKRAHLKDLRIDGSITYLKEIGWDGVDCIYLAQDRD
jgi:hypothetical protein